MNEAAHIPAVATGMTSEPRYFFIIGAMKAGTTSLYNYLADHPELYASPKKEPRVFRDPADTDALRSRLRGLFKGRSAESWCFEGSTAYTKYPLVAGVPQRFASVVPDARFVYMVRNPVERTWSQYVHNLAHGREMRTFAEALGAQPLYLNISRYHLQLMQYYGVFPKERILVQVFEEMAMDPGATVREVCAFLGVDPSYSPTTSNRLYNASSDKRAAAPPLRVARSVGVDKMIPWRLRHWLKKQGTPLPDKRAEFTPELRKLVADSLYEDVNAFFHLLGRRIPAWTDFA